eukprot:SAG31_NODE_17783_length_658_cov_0.608229_1_plen_129_part_00
MRRCAKQLLEGGIWVHFDRVAHRLLRDGTVATYEEGLQRAKVAHFYQCADGHVKNFRDDLVRLGVPDSEQQELIGLSRVGVQTYVDARSAAAPHEAAIEAAKKAHFDKIADGQLKNFRDDLVRVGLND